MVNRTQFRLFSEFAVFPIFAFQNRGNLLSDQHQKAIWLTVIAAILWSTGGLFVKLLTLDAFTILFYRSFYAALLFIVLFRKHIGKNVKIKAAGGIRTKEDMEAFLTAGADRIGASGAIRVLYGE